MTWSVSSVWIWSFASPCQVPRWKRSLTTLEFCGSGKSLLKTGMAHWVQISDTLGREDKPNLEQIFKVSHCHFLHLGRVPGKMPNGVTTKTGDLTIAVPIMKIQVGQHKQSYCRSSLPRIFPFRPSRIRRRWVKISLQTPSSNSWSRSTTRMQKRSKAVMQIFSMKAFYEIMGLQCLCLNWISSNILMSGPTTHLSGVPQPECYQQHSSSHRLVFMWLWCLPVFFECQYKWGTFAGECCSWCLILLPVRAGSGSEDRDIFPDCGWTQSRPWLEQWVRYIDKQSYQYFSG